MSESGPIYPQLFPCMYLYTTGVTAQSGKDSGHGVPTILRCLMLFYG